MEFHTLVFNIKRYEHISGTCSESIMNKGVTELEEMNILLDNAHTKVKGRVLRNHRDRRIYLDQVQNQLRHEKDSSPEVENNKCSLPDVDHCPRNKNTSLNTYHVSERSQNKTINQHKICVNLKLKQTSCQ